jgi:hypothetical protein
MCDECNTLNLAKPEEERFPMGTTEKHAFKKILEPLPKIEDPDFANGEKSNEHFDTRQAFLTLCQVCTGCRSNT